MKIRNKQNNCIKNNVLIQLVEERENGRYGFDDSVFNSIAEFEDKWEEIKE